VVVGVDLPGPLGGDEDDRVVGVDLFEQLV
jgi:hypothetical protein